MAKVQQHDKRMKESNKSQREGLTTTLVLTRNGEESVNLLMY